jgi:Uma2 family endonuclease
MRLDPAYRKITADEFLAIDFGTDRRFELVDGVIQMMTGGTSTHAMVAGNIYHFLRGKLRGSGCMPYNSDMGLRVDATNVRYPDVTVYCGNPAAIEKAPALAFENPVVIIEVLSQSTSSFDQGTKLEEYRQLDSVDTIVFVDPDNELTRVFQRLGPGSWRDDMFAQPHDIDLPSLGVSLSHVEIFARD